MTHPRPITERELNLINLYATCQLELSPQSFYAKWDVSYEQIGYICSRSTTTVRRWFITGDNSRRPTRYDLRDLALMDFLLEHFEEIPAELFDLLCPQNRK